MRFLMLGDCEHYKSPYMRGVKQAAAILGIPHREVSIRQAALLIAERIHEWRPTILWTHMLLWPPKGSPSVDTLIAIVAKAAKEGAKVIIHDGDARVGTRYPFDISPWCSLALVNHLYERSAWKAPTLHWPYFAPVQDKIAQPVDLWRCELFFAGTIGPGPIYGARTALVNKLLARGTKVLVPSDNTIDQTAEIAASADAVLGFGRPDVRGWVDTRVFQYTGSGGILVHDDVQGYLEPWVHYVPYVSGSAESVIEALGRLRVLRDDERMAIRLRAHAYVQENHSSVSRVREVLRWLEAA